MVETRHGIREGRVIVRESAGRVVVTVVTKDNRLFQFYARDVKSVSATEPVLVGQKTFLREQPDEQAAPVAELVPGLEVKVLENKQDSSWIKAAAWTGAEGWLPREVLTRRVEFDAEGNTVSPVPAAAAPAEATPAAASPTQPATPSVEEAAQAVKEATPAGK
ncbi:MAG TPA: SH3 domain-containing protein [bacterium]|nr:SH3 domain-containing protein [bacterium]